MGNWQWIKRSFDLLIAFFAILFLLPFWLLMSLAIYLENPGPLLFCQRRLGKDGTLFTLYKFRSMQVNTLSPLTLGAIKHDHVLVTRVGYFLRRFKLDETPQFVNVLLGQMSLIGPRPCLPERLPTMSLFQKKRLACLPGLSGWAEVNGNVELSWEEQVLLDIWYVDHWSISLDMRILLSTLKVVCFGSKKNELALKIAQSFYCKVPETHFLP